MVRKAHKRHWNGSAMRERLIGALVEGERDALRLAEFLGLEFGQLATLAGKGEVVQTLEGMVRLSELQVQLSLSRGRSAAARKLSAMAGVKGFTELSRKACGDLLKVKVEIGRGTGERKGEVRGPDEAAILLALEELGREEGEERHEGT